MRGDAMPLLLTEADVKSMLTMPLAMELVELSFRRLSEGEAILQPRRRIRTPEKSILHYMAAADLAGGYMGMKIYSVAQGKARFMVPLFSTHTGEPLAFIEADYLGQMRTGAATGVATKFMARHDTTGGSRTMAIIGTGYQAQTQLEAAVLACRPEKSLAFGRDQQRREKFAEEMTSRIGVPVAAASSAQEAVRDADVIITMTSSVKPVLEGAWLKAGVHINAAGSNFAQKAELDAEAVRRCDVIAADSVEQSKMEAGDLIQAFGDDASRWNSVVEFADIVAGKVAGRTSANQITLFKSNGVATEDVVTAGRIYEIAKAKGIGRNVPMWEG
jgi:alanine dehydrogenase